MSILRCLVHGFLRVLGDVYVAFYVSNIRILLIASHPQTRVLRGSRTTFKWLCIKHWFREFSCVYNEENSIIWRASSSFRRTFVFHPPAVALRIFQFLQQMKEAYREQIRWLCSLLHYDSTVHHEEGEGEDKQRMGTAYNRRFFHNSQWGRRKVLFFFF